MEMFWKKVDFCRLLVYNMGYSTDDWRILRMCDANKKRNFSKDNPVVEISSKQNKTATNNVVAPVKPKEEKKTER